MKRRLLFLLVISPLLASFSPVAPQTPPSTQTAPTQLSSRPKWTEADRKAWLFKARRGDRGAQFWLGAANEQGWFGKTNFQEALKWFKRAASQDDPDAQNSLGQMYAEGEGVRQDYAHAAYWYRKAAEHTPDLGGAGQGKNNLGLLYLSGLGVPKDRVQAYMWFRLANVEYNLSQAKSQMNSEQVLQAQRLAADWKSRHPEP